MKNLDEISKFCREHFHRLFAIILVLNFLSLYPDLFLFFSYPWLLTTWKYNQFYALLNTLTSRVGLSDHHWLIFLSLLSLLSSLLLFFNSTKKPGAVFSWVFLNLWLSSNSLFFDASTCIMSVFLFLLGLSILLDDSILFEKWGKIFLCLLYFNTGYSKLICLDWRNGDLLWKLTAAIQSSHNILTTDNLAPFFPAIFLAGWLVILSQLLSPIILFKPTLAPYLGIFEIFAHLFILIFLKLYIFSALMILLNLAFFANGSQNLKLRNSTNKKE